MRFCTLKVLGLVLDTRTEQHYLQLQDEDGKTYRVKPFNYYIDWAGSLDTVDCVVGGIDELTQRPWFKLWAERYKKNIEWIVVVDTYGDHSKIIEKES